MKVLITTPLYPPDNTPQAVYIKELGNRLCATQSLIIATYGNIPEKIKNVEIHSVSKRSILGVRIIKYTLLLWKLSKNIDTIFSENGLSVELPVMLVSSLRKKPIILHIGDESAQLRTKHSFFLKIAHLAMEAISKTTITNIPKTKPEILPFGKDISKENSEYTKSWDLHLEILRNQFEKYGQ